MGEGERNKDEIIRDKNVHQREYQYLTCITANFYMPQIDEYGDPYDLLTALFRTVHDHCNFAENHPNLNDNPPRSGHILKLLATAKKQVRPVRNVLNALDSKRFIFCI